MKTLVFDTCLDKMYVTLAENKNILTSEIVENTESKYHSAFLISTIKRILKKNNITPSDINAIGTNIGPGSFTGIRACTTVARIIGQQLNIPVAGVSSLEILEKLAPHNPLVALDARKNSVYLRYNGITQDATLIEKVKEIIKNGDYTVITDDKSVGFLGGISYQQEKYPLGDILSDIVYEKLKKDGHNWQNLKPLYIQPPPGI